MAELNRTRVQKVPLRWTILAVVLGILAVTLRPIGSVVTPSFHWCVGCSELGTLDLLYNIALFLPLGVLLGLRGVRAGRGLLLAATLSTVIELLQLAIPGRDPSIGDIVANSLGGALGVPLARAPATLRRLTASQLRVLAWSAVLISWGVIALGAWAITVPVPIADYYVQWKPDRVGYAHFGGELHAFEVNGFELQAATRVPAARFPSEYFSVGPHVRARLTPGESHAGIAMIARLVLEYGEFVMLGRQGDALVVRYRSHAPRLGMRSPVLALAGAFDTNTTAELVVDVIKRGEQVEMRATWAGARAPHIVRHDRLTAARFWATLLPLDRGFAATFAAFGDIVWMLLLSVPTGCAAWRAYRGSRRLVAPAAQLGGVALFAATLQPALWWWPAWLGLCAGVLIGFGFGARRAADATA
jgi:hypothetical protein